MMPGYTLKACKDMYTKFGEALGSRGRAMNFNKNFNENLVTVVDVDVVADTNGDAWAISIRLSSTPLR